MAAARHKWLASALLIVLNIAEASPVELIAHRGITCDAAENTLAAVRHAWELGVDGVELDVQVSSDHIAFVFHDEKVRDRRIADLPYQELRRHVAPQAAPTLADVLRLDGAHGYYVLDLKPSAAVNYPVVVDALRRSAFPVGRIAFQSESATVLDAVKSHFPQSSTYYLAHLKRKFPLFTRPRAEYVLRRINPYAIDGVSIKGRAFIDGEFIAVLKQNGHLVNVWTINDPARAEFYASIGVDGLITDKAPLLHSVIRPGTIVFDNCEGQIAPAIG